MVSIPLCPFISFSSIANRHNNDSLSDDQNNATGNSNPLDLLELVTSRQTTIHTTEKTIPDNLGNQNEVQSEKEVKNLLGLVAYTTTMHQESKHEIQSQSKSNAAKKKDIYVVCFLCLPIVLWIMVHVCHKML